jgi:hypothetical protein
MQINLLRTSQTFDDSFNHPSASAWRIAPKENFEVKNQARFRRNHILSVVAFNASAESYNYVVHLVREYGIYPLQPGEFDLADAGGSALNSAEPVYEELK